ncbi:MAG: DNA polymerase I [Actinomycetota bacterium]|nr:DNA polymerase I [Actinomycetota bacterium]
MATLALLDGHSLAYRAFYALPADLATPAGQITNAVFGFTSMLIKLLGDERPDAVAVTWDVRGPQFRKELYPAYKAQREKPPDLFASQLPLIREVLEALDITQIEAPGYEADDVIATMVGSATAEGWRVIVVTGDRDAFQLIDDDVAVMYTRRGISDTVMADAAWIMERYGIAPRQYLDYAALRGDTSDNLPGVPGVGEKTATKLVAEHGDLEEIYRHLDEQTPRIRANLAEHRDQVFLNRQVMTMAEVPEAASIDVDGLRLGQWDHDRVRKVFDGLAFRTLWERLVELGGQGAVESTEIDVEVTTAHTAADLAAVVRAGTMAVEAVYDGPDLVGITAAAGEMARFVPVERLAIVAEAVSDGGLAGHDIKQLLRHFLAAGLEAPAVRFDTALGAYLVNPGQRAPDLEELAYRELGLAVSPIPDGEPIAAQVSFDFDAPPQGSSDRTSTAIEASARRAVAVAALMTPLQEQIEVRGGADLYEEIELPLVGVLARMEETGIAVDRETLTNLGGDLRRRLGELETAIHEAAGEVFNINSTLQLRHTLYENLGLPILKKTAKGVPSTDASVLEKLRDAHPMVDHLLVYRELEKLRSTYVDALLPLIEPDGRVRGRFNQMAAATGRLSQEQPNLQNIPVRSDEGRVIRTAFVAAPGHRLLTADYSQIELRILAHLSADHGLVDAFRAGLDIHTATAARVAGITPAEVTTAQRRRAKVINFGLLYGMEAYGLAQRLDISRQEAEGHVAAYFDQFPQVRAFMRGIVDQARSTGFTTTLLGRRRYLPELASSNFRQRQMGERMALNAPIQGSAADIIKKAMVELEGELASAGLGSAMLLQIHDELVLEVPDDEITATTEVTRTVMEGIVDLDVPLMVDTATGANLAECKV